VDLVLIHVALMLLLVQLVTILDKHHAPLARKDLCCVVYKRAGLAQHVAQLATIQPIIYVAMILFMALMMLIFHARTRVKSMIALKELIRVARMSLWVLLALILV